MFCTDVSAKVNTVLNRVEAQLIWIALVLLVHIVKEVRRRECAGAAVFMPICACLFSLSVVMFCGSKLFIFVCVAGIFFHIKV